MSDSQARCAFPRICCPSARSEEHHHRLACYPDSKRSVCFWERLRPVFSYLPASVIVLRCAAARLGCMQSLPVQPDFHARTATISWSPIRSGTTKRQGESLGWVTESFAGNVLKKGGLRSYTYFDFWWQFPQKILLPWFSWCQPSEPLKTTCQGGFRFWYQQYSDRLVLSNQARSKKNIQKWVISGKKLIFGLIQPLILNFSRQCWRDKVIYGSFLQLRL